MPIGVPELLLVLAIVLLVLGPKRLPGLGRQLGGGFRELRDGLRGRHEREDAVPPSEPEVLDGEVMADRKR
jgi:sec-independent protein translocase protein TatA